MRLKKLLKASLIIILWTTSTNATPTTKSKTTLLDAGEKAPFEGFLVPEWQFRKINQDLIEKDMLKEQLAKPAPVPENNTVQVFIIGFLSGSAAVLLAEKLGGK